MQPPLPIPAAAIENMDAYLRQLDDAIANGGPYIKRSMTVRRFHVLVLDDDHFTRQTVTLLLNDPRWILHFAGSAMEAAETYAWLHPHVVFLDIELPDVSGLEVLRSISKHDLFAHSIMLTGTHDLEHVRQAQALGAKEYVAKPFNRQKLVECMQRYMGFPIF